MLPPTWKNDKIVRQWMELNLRCAIAGNCFTCHCGKGAIRCKGEGFAVGEEVGAENVGVVRL
jgi:hypothetical protein